MQNLEIKTHKPTNTKICIHSPQTKIAPEKWWLGDDPFLWGLPIFGGYM